MLTRGCLIAFSGLDGAGKTTQINLLIEQLRRTGSHPVYVWSRGGYTWFFNFLKSVLRNLTRNHVIPQSGKSYQRTRAFQRTTIRNLWLELALIELLWLYGVRIRWRLWRGQIVIADRYLWDTLVDFRLNFPQEKIEQWILWRILVKITPKPDASFLLLVPVAESCRRSDVKGEPFRDSQEILTRRLFEYQSLAKNDRWYILDGLDSVVKIHSEILAVLGQTQQSIRKKKQDVE